VALVSQALVGPARDEAGNGHEDAVIKGERVAKDVSKDADVFHRGQRVLDDDADTGEVRIVQFLLRRERMGLAALVGQGDAALRRVVNVQLLALTSRFAWSVLSCHLQCISTYGVSSKEDATYSILLILELNIRMSEPRVG